MNRTRQKRARGFTLIELVVVLAMIAVMAALLLPVHASVRSQSNRAKCASNLHQLGVGYNIYAQDSYGWYPITDATGNHIINQITGGYYTRWIFFNGSLLGTHLNFKSGTPINWTDFGSLYPQRLAGDGKIFYCPDLTDKHALLGSTAYEPLLTTDSGGNVRGSYLVNFHNGNNVAPDGLVHANIRTYQKMGDVRSRVVFGMDFFDSTQFDSSGNVTTDSINFAHSQSKGWNVMYNDGSVNFIHVPARQMKLLWLSGWNSSSDAFFVNQLASLVETNSP